MLLASTRSLSSQRESQSNLLSRSLSHGMFDDERRAAKNPRTRVHAPWEQLITDKPWTAMAPNQIEVRCEAMRHVEKLLPAGGTAYERKQAALRASSTLLETVRGPAAYATVEPARGELARKIPPSHDVKFRKSAMPVGSSLLESRRPW